MEKITKDTLINEVLDMDVNLAKFFFEIGMHCLGCPSAKNETVGEACEVHGQDVGELVDKLNAALASAEKE